MEYTLEIKAQISFTQVNKLVLHDIDETTWALIIPLASPPIFFKKVHNPEAYSNKSLWSDRDSWNRTVDITYDTTWFKDDPVSLNRYNQFVDIGRWTTYRLVFPVWAKARWAKMQLALNAFNVQIEHRGRNEFSLAPVNTFNVLRLLDTPSSSTTTTGASLELLANTEHIYLPFDVRYQLEACISQGFLNEVNITAEFLRMLADLSNERTQRRNRAKDLLMYVSQPRTGGFSKTNQGRLDEKRIYDPMSLFKDRKALSHYPEISLPEHCQWVRKVVITATTMYLSNPTPEPSNRVLRHFASHEDRFIRVQFMDEMSRGPIYSAPDSTQANALFNRVHRTLQNGIVIGGRRFEYLATGNSQFRERGAYFFCPTEYLSCQDIRDWMGEVSHIRVVAKYAARLGQCFSTTKIPRASPIGQRIKHIEDIEHHGWNFTDGVGKIAPRRARFLIDNLVTGKTVKYVPSVFQFRLGGSKGILVQWPDVPFNEVHLRPSQNKFTATSQGLEIIKTSRFSVATLNRQTIIILDCLGVPGKVFQSMMKKQIASYERAMEDSEAAMSLLCKYADQTGITTVMAQMVADGFMAGKEPFLMMTLQVWRAWSMKMLREKARIVVEQGAFVFGCADETQTLRGHSDSVKPGDKNISNLPQIFLQVPKTSTNAGEPSEYTVITGVCMLGRNPSLHPGDIRVVEAVDVPALRHLRDVVVFSTKGDRDIPSMCSGGDLDGDDYFVIWDPELIPDEWNHTPMPQETLKPMELNRDVTVRDLISFFVQYMKNDSLSTIAHAHLAKSDRLADGPKDPQCIELARLHSNAVDYPKTGQEALLKPSLRPKAFPHFMEKLGGKTYHSTNILGKLYDQVTKIEFKPNFDGAFNERILRAYALDQEMLGMVRMIKRQHDKSMRQIMNQHEIGNEFEAWSLFVLSKPRMGNDYKRQEVLEPVLANHRERFKAACIKLAKSTDADVLYPVIAAAYYVTWEEVQVKKMAGQEESTPDSVPLISFPWIFASELGQIATSKGKLALDEMPKPSGYNHSGDDDDGDFERLVGAGVVEGDEAANGKGGIFDGYIASLANKTQLKDKAGKATVVVPKEDEEKEESSSIYGDQVVLDEDEDEEEKGEEGEENSMGLLATLNGLKM
ncbi:RNA dependent RNA polymerase-domain-containing protein [Hypoxylon fragiforme]|uniref:RNA dependent RNA polymerase-domain-containing protein n=1 Tax=Hypoxylon fragiforme TaxID=63214 RepID=UPI0020C71995|nr:RNA dependent RNA polymerase-domain-containing protein [Hypoxylon fragiforme]KAI2604768.1 RNA dependent RNA polymerase-domain-containing protein [Hypoxylon fragiforme]